MSLKSLISQTASYGVTTIITRFINYLLTPYFTYISFFSESMYGVMNYYYSLIPFGLMILSLGLESGYFRFCGKSQTEENKKALFNSLFSFIILIAFIFFVIILVFTNDIFQLLGSIRAGNRAIIPLVGAIIAIDAITAIPFAYLREKAEVKKFMRIKLLSVVTNFILCIVFYSLLPYLEHNGLNTYIWQPSFGVGYVFIANLTASLLSLILLVKYLKDFKFEIKNKTLKRVLVFSLPIFIGGLAGIANDFIDRQLLYFILPETKATYELGIYSAVMKLGAFIYLFTQMYRYAAEPYFLSQVKKEDFLQRNADALKYFTIASLSIFLFINLFLEYFQYFIGEKYRSGLSVAPIVLLSNVLFGVYINLSYWYKVKEKTMIAIYISLVGFIVNISINLLLIPKYGYEGSAWARLCCFLIMVILAYILNQKYMHTPYDIKSLAKYFLLTGLLLYMHFTINLEFLVEKTLVSILFFLIFVAYFIYEERIFKRFIKK